jgi:hypothetical protein
VLFKKEIEKGAQKTSKIQNSSITALAIANWTFDHSVAFYGRCQVRKTFVHSERQPGANDYSYNCALCFSRKQQIYDIVCFQ